MNFEQQNLTLKHNSGILIRKFELWCDTFLILWRPTSEVLTQIMSSLILFVPLNTFLKWQSCKIKKLLIDTLVNNRLRVSKVSWKFAVIYPSNLLFSQKLAYFLTVSIVLYGSELYLSTKFQHQEIRWNYYIFHSHNLYDCTFENWNYRSRSSNRSSCVVF